jgi:hypothetical protein
MKKYILSFIFGSIVIFVTNSQENFFNSLFFYNLYLKNDRYIYGFDLINLNPCILREFDVTVILRNNFLEYKNIQNTNESTVKTVNNTQGYSGLASLLGVMIYYIVPNNLRHNRQQREMMRNQLNKNMEYHKISNNNGYNGFR